MSHRGPDGFGVALGRLQLRSCRFFLRPFPKILRQHARVERSDLFLGHRRLSIIDLAPGAFQPMGNENGLIWVVFNGEIYNHAELRRDLETRGHRFRTDHSDTEVLVHGYEQWGSNLVDHLRGMFAFAVVDLEANRVFLARDRFGEKPLYYLTSNSGVAFASELKALMCLPGVDRTLSRHALVDYLNHGQIPAPRTVFQDVRKLRAAERVSVCLDDPRAAEPETYWSVDYDPQPGRSGEEWFEAFRAELEESIRLRLISDVPLGTFLSGGLDSTVVTGQASRILDGQLSTFSIGFAEKRYDESPWAARAAQHFHTSHHTKTVSAADLLDAVGTVGEVFDEPFADSSAVPTYLVSCLAREHVSVALSGDGGDELLAGYARYLLHHRLGRLLDKLPDTAVKLFLGPLARLWPESVRGKGLARLLLPGGKARYFQSFLDRRLVELARPGLSDDWQCSLESAWSDQPGHPIDRMCQFDRRFYIPEDLMVKVDRTSMRVSLEARAPLLDHKLFELVGRMPLPTRFDGRVGKLPLRKILAGELGQEFVDRPKRGFSVPLGTWFRHELREELRDTLLQREGIVASLFPRDNVEQLIDGHQSGSRDQSPRLWKLYMLQKWADCHGQEKKTDLENTPVLVPAA